MSSELIDQLPESIKRIVPYKAGRTAKQISGATSAADVIKLSSNENPLGTGQLALQALAGASVASAHLYPDGGAVDLREAIGAHLGVAMETVVCGNGSNEILELCASLTLRPGRKAVFAKHAFVVYRLATLARGATEVEVPAAGYGHDLDAMAQACQQEDVGIVFVANPNNPTGTWHPPEAIEKFVASVPASVLVVIDEAYHEYAMTGSGPTLALAARHPNVVITRTFSKIHGLAGLRIGYGIASGELAAMLHRVRQPFNTNCAAQAAACAALADDEFVERSRATNDAGMRQMLEGLANLNYPTLLSQANFVTFYAGEQTDAEAVYARLLDAGLIIRQIAEYGLPGWLRATIGAPQHNERLLAALLRREA